MRTEEGFTEIVQWRSHEMPEALDALIVPEDTYRILQAVTEELDPHATPLDLWASLERAARMEKHPLGSAIIAEGERRGVKYIASVIVYDFDGETISSKEVVLAGLDQALRELAKRGCETIGVFPLGTMRGGISLEEYFRVLNEVAGQATGDTRRTLYLLGQDETSAQFPDG